MYAADTASPAVQQPVRAGQFVVSLVDESEASAELARLRVGRAGRESKYKLLGDECIMLEPGEVLATDMGRNEVGGFRGYLRRRFGDRFDVRSARHDFGGFGVYVFVKDES